METMSFWRLNEILTQHMTFGVLAKMIFVPSVMSFCMLQLLVWAHKEMLPIYTQSQRGFYGSKW